MNVINTQFINPFEAGMSKDKLCSVISGVSFDEIIVESLEKRYEQVYQAFNCIEDNKETFPDAIKKFLLKTFQDSFVKVKVWKNGKQGEIRVQSDILGKLVSLSFSNKVPINLEHSTSNSEFTIKSLWWHVMKTVKSKFYHQAAMYDLAIVN